MPATSSDIGAFSIVATGAWSPAHARSRIASFMRELDPFWCGRHIEGRPSPRYRMPMPHRSALLRCLLFVFALTLAACSEPPDETPLGRETATILARPVQKVDQV